MKKDSIKKYFFAGILATLPIFLTLYVTFKVCKFLYMLAVIIPYMQLLQSKIDTYLSSFASLGISYILSVVIAAILLCLIGLLSLNYLGQLILVKLENIILKVPFSKTIYSSFKQISEVFFSNDSSFYKRVVMIEYPREGVYSIGFLTNDNIQITNRNNEVYNDYVTVFIPATPNPASGHLIVVKRDQIVFINMSVDDAAKLIISGGTVKP